MQIEVLDNLNDGTWRCRAAAGSFRAAWNGEPPVVGERYSVELELAGILQWPDDIRAAEQQVASIVDDPDGVRITGRVGGIEERGAIVVLDVQGAAVMLETKDVPASAVGVWVTARLPSVTLYPYRL